MYSYYWYGETIWNTGGIGERRGQYRKPQMFGAINIALKRGN